MPSPPKLKTGKLPPKTDSKTLRMASFISSEVSIPDEYDYDQANNVVFPGNMFGNDTFNDCVPAGRANQVYRLEYKEQSKIIKITYDDVVNTYERLTGTKQAGDQNDEGMTIISGLNDWKRGWKLSDGNKYDIAAFGKVTLFDHWLMRVCTYWFGGVQLGVQLPLFLRSKPFGTWDIQTKESPLTVPGSWGGHLVYVKGYTKDGVRAMTWGQEVIITDAFLYAYADEAWAVIDNMDKWLNAPSVINIAAMMQQMTDLGIRVRV